MVLLDIVAESHGLASPLDPVAHFDETRRFFFLNRPAGWRRRNTMLEPSARMRRIVARLAEGATTPTILVPVSIFWGRAANKDRSWIRALFSEGWAVSSGLRRFLILVANRRDILVGFGDPLDWGKIVRPGESEALATRRTARLLRVKFRNQKVAALGPDLSHRRSLVEQILRSPAVASAVDDAVGDGAGRARVERAARRAAYDIAADVSYPAIRLLDRLLTWFWHRIYDGVEITGFANFEALAESHTLVYTPCHRSHIDYLLLSYVLYHRGLMLPHIAAGDNLDLPVVGRILRGGGAFFMRRHFGGDRVYAAVFSEYVYRVFRRGHAMEYFVEGGRSRTGRLLPARSGMLRMTIDAHRRGMPRPIIFVPVYIGYEKIIEGDAYLAELGGASKRRETVAGVLRNLNLVRESFGTARVCFGKPIHLAEFLDGCADADPARALGEAVLEAVNACAFVNAVDLVALATLATPRDAIDEADLAMRVDLYRELIERHADDTDHGVTGAPTGDIIRHVESLGLLEREPGVADDAGRTASGNDILVHGSAPNTWYRNNVLHVVAAPSLIACLLNSRRAVRSAVLRRVFNDLYPYVANELHARPESADRWLGHLEALGLVERRRGTYIAPNDARAQLRLRLLGNLVVPIVERFYIGVALLDREGIGTLDAETWLAECLAIAERYVRLHGINTPEFADPELFTQFLEQLVRHGMVRTLPGGGLSFDDRITSVVHAGRRVVAEELRLILARK